MYAFRALTILVCFPTLLSVRGVSQFAYMYIVKDKRCVCLAVGGDLHVRWSEHVELGTGSDTEWRSVESKLPSSLN